MPRFLGPKLKTTLIQRLRSEVEGTCSGKHGYIVAITAVDSLGEGMIIENKGLTVFKVSYKAIVFRPFKGEVVDAVVTAVNKVGRIDFIAILLLLIQFHRWGFSQKWGRSKYSFRIWYFADDP